MLKSIEKDLLNMRREFHRIPELGFEEELTSGKIKSYLEKWDYKVKSGVGKTGITATLNGGRPGKTLAFRVDMDALPIEEETNMEFSSFHKGKMHACGHDGHITIGLGTARILAQLKDRIGGKIKFIFQPAEELLAGAEAMVEDDVLKDPDVDAIIGLHIWPELESGCFGLRKGPMMAAADKFELEIIGSGGHGALPHKTRDPVVAAAEVIESLQKIISRELDPIKAGAISIGIIEGGSAYNIIPGQVELTGTVRTIDPEIRKFISRRMEKRIKGIITGMRGKYNFNFSHINPAVVNDDELTGKVENIIRKHFGANSIENSVDPVMVSEDFAIYQQEVPGTYLLLGTRNEEKGIVHSVHHPGYNIDEDVLLTGVELFCRLAIEFN